MQHFDSNILMKISSLCSKNNGRFPVSKFVRDNLHLDLPETSMKRRAAVLIPLVNRNGVASIMFQVRSYKVGSHKGQVSFPGGHIDANESPVEAALRETVEELGMHRQYLDIEIIGIGQTVPAITGTLVTPVIGYFRDDVGDLSKFSYNRNEVSRIFTRTVEELQDKQRNSFETLERDGMKMKMPIFGINDNDERIWGLTALILRQVLSIIDTASAKQ